MTVNEAVFKVVHAKDGVETVYVVLAESRRDAVTRVLDTLYERNHPVDPPYTPEELANDPFYLKAHVATHGVDWSNSALCKQHNCSVSAQPWRPEEPYKLYALNMRTGEMT